MKNDLKAIVYITINTINNKFYIGAHLTETPYVWDNYYGCGITGASSAHYKHPKTPFQRACKKYGLKAFKRYTLFVYDEYEDALEMEKQIVTEEFIKRKDTYNVALGGGSGLVPTEEIPVHQYDLSGKYLTTYRSISDAGRKNHISYQSIHSAIISNGICKGNYWTKIKCESLSTNEFKKPQAIPVYYYDKSGKLIGSASSMSKLANKLSVKLTSVQRAVRRKTLCAGYYVSTEKATKFKPEAYTRNRNVPVYQYNSEGNFIRKYETQELARKKLNKKLYRLADCIIEQRKCEGFYWSYEPLSKFLVKHKSKQVAQYDLKGNLIKIWPTVRSCRAEFSNVKFVLSGKLSQTKGYKFKYVI